MAVQTGPGATNGEGGGVWERVIGQASLDWGIPRPFVTTVVLFPVVISLIAIVGGAVNRPLFDLLTGEDALGEWLQVLGWVVTLGFAVVVASRLGMARSPLLFGLYALLVMGVVFIVGEEISWGQRLFGWGTPEPLQEVNRQGETNLHNIYGVQTAFAWAMFVVGLYGTAAPLLALRRFGAYSSWPAAVQALVPHWLLLPYFLLMLVWRFYRNLFEPLDGYYFAISRFGEVTELVLVGAFVLFMWHQWKRTRTQATGSASPNQDMSSRDALSA